MNTMYTSIIQLEVVAMIFLRASTRPSHLGFDYNKTCQSISSLMHTSRIKAFSCYGIILKSCPDLANRFHGQLEQKQPLCGWSVGFWCSIAVLLYMALKTHH